MRLVGVVGRGSMSSKSLSAQAAISSPAAAAVARRDRSRPLLVICNATAALYQQAFGRGPTTVHAHDAGPNTMVVLLEQTLTAAERNLVALGEQDRLRESRLESRAAYARGPAARHRREHARGAARSR